MTKPAVMAGVVVSLTSYFAVYVVLLLLALLLLPISGAARTTVTIATMVFIAASVALVVVLFMLPGRAGRIVEHLSRVRPLQTLAKSFGQADSKLVRQPRLLFTACACDAAIILLDAATVWVLVKAFGATASGIVVFSSFMISNLFRTLGVLPGGLGTFETSSVLTLQFVGVPLARRSLGNSAVSRSELLVADASWNVAFASVVRLRQESCAGNCPFLLDARAG